MKYVLYGILVLTIIQHSRAQYRKIQLTDAKQVEHLKMEKRWNTRCKYDEGFIYNKDYMIYQTCDTAVTFYPDRKTFQIKKWNYGFAVDKNGVYYQGQFIKVDTTGFKILASREIKEIEGYVHGIDSYYWRTNGGVFFGTKRLSVSDPQTFEALTYCYFRDKNHVYYYDQIIEGVTPNLVNEELSRGELLNEGKNVYYKGKRLYHKGEAVEQVSSMIFKTSKYVLGYNGWEDEQTHSILVELHSEPFDIPTLRTLSDSYLIDKNHLYYIPPSYPVRDEGFRVPVSKEELSSIRVFTKFVVVGSTVYYERKPEKRYDAATFEVIPAHQYYQYDKKGIYNWDYKLPFRYTNRPQYGKNFFYMDDQHLFVYEDQAYYRAYNDSLYVPHLTPRQLALLKKGNTPLRELFPSQDDKQKNKKIDTTGFEELSYFFWRHNGQIYHLIYKEWYDYEQNDWKSERQYVVVKGYDNASLKAVPNGFLADKDYWYYGTTRLFPSKAVELLAIYEGYRKGCGLDNTPTTNFYLFKNAQGYWLAELGGEGAMCPLTNEQASKLLNQQ